MIICLYFLLGAVRNTGHQAVRFEDFQEKRLINLKARLAQMKKSAIFQLTDVKDT